MLRCQWLYFYLYELHASQPYRACDHYWRIQTDGPRAREMATDFKKTFCWPDVRVHFVGVWYIKHSCSIGNLDLTFDQGYRIFRGSLQGRRLCFCFRINHKCVLFSPRACAGRTSRQVHARVFRGVEFSPRQVREQ